MVVVNGIVEMKVSLHAIDLITDAVELDSYNNIVITNPEQFFMDWAEAWDSGEGELLGATDENKNLEVRKRTY